MAALTRRHPAVPQCARRSRSIIILPQQKLHFARAVLGGFFYDDDPFRIFILRYPFSTEKRSPLPASAKGAAVFKTTYAHERSPKRSSGITTTQASCMRGCCNKISSTAATADISPPYNNILLRPVIFDIAVFIHAAEVAAVMPALIIQCAGGKFRLTSGIP